MNLTFKEEIPFEHRRAEAAGIRIKYPERVPVIIEKLPGSQVNGLDKRKFLIPSDISISQLCWIIRKRIRLESEKALFLFVGKTIPSTSASVGEIYDEFKDEDGFLYVQFSGENTFGGDVHCGQ
jgi:GABA(A) receptor-associated protein